MKAKLAAALLALASLSAAADLNAPPAGISGESRAALVAQLREMRDGAVWWAENYSYGAVDYSYYMGRAEGFQAAAYILESYGIAP